MMRERCRVQRDYIAHERLISIGGPNCVLTEWSPGDCSLYLSPTRCEIDKALGPLMYLYSLSQIAFTLRLFSLNPFFCFERNDRLQVFPQFDLRLSCIVLKSAEEPLECIGFS